MLIYNIENLMRQLITKFMVVKVGKNWVAEASPQEFKDALEKNKPKSRVNVLQNVDFSDLATLLLKPYPKGNDVQKLYAKLTGSSTIDDLNACKEYIPESNWTRYFKAVVACDELYLKTRWEELYKLRCQVAHNATIAKAEFDQITTLVGELEGKLQDAIKKLPQLNVPEGDRQQIAENAAQTIVDARPPIGMAMGMDAATMTAIRSHYAKRVHVGYVASEPGFDARLLEPGRAIYSASPREQETE